MWHVAADNNQEDITSVMFKVFDYIDVRLRACTALLDDSAMFARVCASTS